jgi:hypothetical protein
MPMPLIVAGPDLSRRPLQPEQEGRLPEQEPGGGVQPRLGQERQCGQRSERKRIGDADALSSHRHGVERVGNPNSMCGATNSSSGPAAVVVAI